MGTEDKTFNDLFIESLGRLGSAEQGSCAFEFELGDKCPYCLEYEDDEEDDEDDDTNWEDALDWENDIDWDWDCDDEEYFDYNEVNHPEHYNHGGIETLDIIKTFLSEEEFRGYIKGNIIKYRERHPYKGKSETDLKKAKFYYDLLNE